MNAKKDVLDWLAYHIWCQQSLIEIRKSQSHSGEEQIAGIFEDVHAMVFPDAQRHRGCHGTRNMADAPGSILFRSYDQVHYFGLTCCACTSQMPGVAPELGALCNSFPAKRLQTLAVHQSQKNEFVTKKTCDASYLKLL